MTLKKYTLAIIFCKKNMAAAQKSTAATMVMTYSFLQLRACSDERKISLLWPQSIFLQLRAGSDEGLTGLVAFILLEILDEACSEVLSLLLPL